MIEYQSWGTKNRSKLRLYLRGIGLPLSVLAKKTDIDHCKLMRFFYSKDELDITDKYKIFKLVKGYEEQERFKREHMVKTKVLVLFKFEKVLKGILNAPDLYTQLTLVDKNIKQIKAYQKKHALDFKTDDYLLKLLFQLRNINKKKLHPLVYDDLKQPQ